MMKTLNNTNKTQVISKSGKKLPGFFWSDITTRHFVLKLSNREIHFKEKILIPKNCEEPIAV